MPNAPLLCLMGATGTGKSDLALQIASKWPVEIISVDSAMVYRRMDIGTAKPSCEDRAQVVHHLVDSREADEPYNVQAFYQDAQALIFSIRQAGKIPLLVGGSSLYFNALRSGLSALPPADALVRDELLAQAQDLGWEAMHQRLTELDPSSAARIHPNDKQRIMRGLEIFRITGKPWSLLCQENKPVPFGKRLNEKPSEEPGEKSGEKSGEKLEENTGEEFVALVLQAERPWLHERLARRFEHMINTGLVEEVQYFFDQPERFQGTPAMASVGYKQVWQYLQGDLNVDQMKEKAIISTRQLARHQETWLRGWPGVHGISAQALASSLTSVREAELDALWRRLGKWLEKIA